ncbi:MAG: ASKHA domain-containing protein [Nitrospiraceae bacterium]|nr:ASKHA domain-containing protein [Nitrospiraceae bacterium]
MKKHRVIFQPSGRRGEVADGTDLLDAARNLGVDIESICGGKGTCGKCKVRVEEGFFEKDSMDSRMEHLSQLTEVERKFLKPSDGPGMRLACAARALGDVKIFVPEKSRAGKQIVRKAAKELNIRVEPAVKKYFVELEKPSLHEVIKGDLEKLLAALEKNYGLSGLSMDFPVLKDLQDTIRKGNWGVTVSVWKGREIIKVEPGFIEASYGLAVDVGTTTVVGYLTDLATGKVMATESMMNPQVPYGEDVMSRITYAMTNPDGVGRMQKAIIDGLNEIISNITKALSAEAPGGGEAIVDMTIVFNTAMHHILLGFNPEHIGRSPFIPAIQHGLDIKARDLGIRINPGSYIYVLPIEAGFVGADNVGVLIAMEPYNMEEKVLIIDIGTNGELLLGNKDRVCSTSCATGPAFEGAQIKMGMRAAPGAIEKVKIDPATKEPLYKVIGKEEWHINLEKIDAKGICGSGIIDAIAWMYRAGIIDKSGRFDMNVESPRVRKDHEGKPEYVLAWARETSIGGDITITQGDVRALQLAKGALYAGAKLMMRRMGLEKLDKVMLAGAFGSFIDKESAMTLGMFPDCDIDNVYAVGNAAGDGARMALVSLTKRGEAEEKARWVEFVEIAVEPAFEKEFMQAMHLPHMKDSFPNLKKLIEKESPHVVIKG